MIETFKNFGENLKCSEIQSCQEDLHDFWKVGCDFKKKFPETIIINSNTDNEKNVKF